MSEYNVQKGPILSVAISPRDVGDREKFQRALSILAQEDPAFRIKTAQDNGPSILSGMSELHLEVVCGRLWREFEIQLDIGERAVIYLETLRESAEAEGKYIRNTGGVGNYGHCKLRVEPNEPGEGYEFINDIKGGVIPKEYIEPIDQAVQETLDQGVLAGYPLVDIKVTLFDGSYHDLDSNEMAFRIAGSIALKDAARKASPVLLEPVMTLEVTVPEERMADCIGDLNSRRGRIESMEHVDGSQRIKALVPLAELLGYRKDLRGSHSIHFSRYEATPRRDWFGGDGAGITANKPVGPRAGSGSASVRLYPEAE
jgi:elongation factor G